MDVRFSIRPELRQRMREVARTFRKEPTQTEKLLWPELRNRRLEGKKFRRQHPIGPFVVDFFCREERLVIEIDGPIHKGQSTADQERHQLLEAAGLRVIRVSAAQTWKQTSMPCSTGFDKSLLPPLSRARERGDRQVGVRGDRP